jgi:hypothetical protein
MTKRNRDRFAALAADIASPRVVAAIDKALEEIRQEWLDLSDLRKMAVRRHGEMGASPDAPCALTEASAKVGLIAPPVGKNKNQITDVAALVSRYRDDKRSSYHALRFKTRQHYDNLIRHLIEDCTGLTLADLKPPTIARLYEGWAEGGKVAMGHAMIAILRVLANYGAKTLEDEECVRLSVILRSMRFEVAKSRNEPLTIKQAEAIITTAHAKGLDSIALAQAFQFDLMLGQKDVIGEWVPHSEPGVSDVTFGDEKWLRGIRWSEIGNDLVLRHASSRDGTLMELPLSDCPLIKAEFARIGKLPHSGPIIVSEATDYPYTGHSFRRLWRIVARKAGVPEHVKNMDSRVNQIRDEQFNDPEYLQRRAAEIKRRANATGNDDKMN